MEGFDGFTLPLSGGVFYNVFTLCFYSIARGALAVPSRICVLESAVSRLSISTC